MTFRQQHPGLLVDDVTGRMGYENPVTGKDVEVPDPSNVAIAGASTVGGAGVSAIAAAAAQIALSPILPSFSALSNTPPAVLDLNYASKMALYGVETFARAGTDTYTDMLGVGQTAGTNVAPFDRQAHTSNLPWVVPKGLKTSGSATCNFNAAGMLPSSGFTLVIDCDRPTAFSGAGTILALHDGTVANRVEVICTSNYQVQLVVQSGGSVVVNQALGSIQNWYGGPRRIVVAVKSAAFAYSDDGQYSGSTASGAAPSSAALTNFNVGCSTQQASYFTGWIKRVQVLPFALSQAQVTNLAGGVAPIALWGDSLTAGTGATGPSGFYPEVVRTSRYPHSGVYNGGVGGETSTQIKARALADTIRNGWTSVFWAGRNNFSSLSTVVADVQAMVSNLTHGRYLVMGVINKSDGTENAGSTAYTQIVALNAALQAAFPNNYLDIRSLIVAASGGSNDAPNASWTADGLHLNNTGYAYVASQVSSFLNAKQWY